MTPPGACPACLARAWLLSRLAAHLDLARDRIAELLELGDRKLIEAVGGRHRGELECELAGWRPGGARARAAKAGLELVCRCHPSYPGSLTALDAPPAVLHVAGGLERLLALLGDHPVAIVGARRPSTYGVDVTRSLARGLGAASVTVVSGMALGIDMAAHRGVLDVEAGTVAILPAGADRPYPASALALHRRIRERGAIVSELPPGTPVRRWMFPARNRIIAALGEMTIVVEARPGSGALLTAGWARRLGRAVGTVPGRVTSPLAAGPHELLRSGAELISGPQDVLDGLFGVGTRPAVRRAEPLAPDLEALLQALADGHEPEAALGLAGLDADHGLAALASLELAGRVRREAGGRFSVLP
jgi:DNA processing protein